LNAPKQRQKLWWTAVILSAGAFVLVSLAYVASGFADRASPVNDFLNRHGGTLTLVMAGLTIGSGVLAMWLDGRLQRLDPSEAPDSNGAGDVP